MIQSGDSFILSPAEYRGYTASSEINSPEEGGVPSSDPLARDSLGTDDFRTPTFSAGRLKRYPAATGSSGRIVGVFGRRVPCDITTMISTTHDRPDLTLRKRLAHVALRIVQSFVQCAKVVAQVSLNRRSE